MSATAPYQVCVECFAEYATADALLDAHNQVLAAMNLPPEVDAEHVRCCPECVHDFLYPPVKEDR